MAKWLPVFYYFEQKKIFSSPPPMQKKVLEKLDTQGRIYILLSPQRYQKHYLVIAILNTIDK